MWPDRNHIVHDWKVFRNRCSVKINILFPHFIAKVKNKLHCYFENTGYVLISSSHAKWWVFFSSILTLSHLEFNSNERNPKQTCYQESL